MIFIEKLDDLLPDISEELVKNAAVVALKHQSVFAENADLTIVLTDDKQIQKLNQQWMDVDGPTDVLSFPSDEIDPESGNRYFGDILISVQRAAEQAKVVGHPVEAEIQLLVVHGVLHLMGHDHAGVEEKDQMWKAQGEILAQLGLGNLVIRE
jgi:probable rRNA maturation factor